MTRIVLLVVGLSLLGWSAAGPCAEATEELPAPLMDGKSYLHVFHDGRSERIQRIQDPDHGLKEYFAKTARNCSPFCIHAMKVADGLVTVGELEMFELMEARMRDGTGMLIDSRTPEWYNKRTSPGSVDYPFTDLTKPRRIHFAFWDNLFPELGAKPAEEPGFVDQRLESLGLAEDKAAVRQMGFFEREGRGRFLQRTCMRPNAAGDYGLACGRLPGGAVVLLPRWHADVRAVGIDFDHPWRREKLGA